MLLSNHSNIEIISQFSHFTDHSYFLSDVSEASIVVEWSTEDYKKSANKYKNSLYLSSEYLKKFPFIIGATRTTVWNISC